MEGQDKLRSFYDKIKSNPNVTGLPDDYEVFKSALSDTNKAKGFYDTLKKGGAITGLPDDFSGFSSILPEPAENTEKTDAGKKKGFWDTYAGDLIEKVGAGTVTFGGSMYSALDHVNNSVMKPWTLPEHQDSLDRDKYPELAKTLDELGVPESERGLTNGKSKLKVWAENAHDDAGNFRERAVRNEGKDFKELWKNGDYSGAVGDVFLQASESLPQSLMAMFGGGAGLALTGVSAGTNKYDVIDKDPDTKDLPEYRKVINAVATGTFEALTERLGDVPIGNWLKGLYSKAGREVAEQTVSSGFKRFLKNGFKKYGVLVAPVAEGVEEIAAQISENATDYCTGVSDKLDLMRGVPESFVYGMGGGMQFSAVALPGLAMRKIERRKTNRDYRKAREVLEQVFPDSNVDAFEEGLSGMSQDDQREILGNMMNNPDLNDEQKAIVTDFFLKANKHQAYNSPEAKAEDDAWRLLEEKVNKKSGDIVTAKDVDDNPVYVLDETDRGFLVEYQNGEKKFVAAAEVQGLSHEPIAEHVKKYINTFSQGKENRIPKVGDDVFYNGERARVQRVDDDGTVIEVGDNRVEKVPSGALQFDEGTQEAQAADPDAVVSETSVADVPTDAQPVQIPQTKEGSPDYNTMLESDPELFATEWEKRSTPESTKAALEKRSGQIGGKIESLLKNLEKESDFNRIAENEDEIARLKGHKERVDGVLAERYAVREEEEVVTEHRENSEHPVFSNEEEAVRWVAENSEDVGEILGTYEVVRGMKDEGLRNAPRWQQELLGKKIKPKSFYENGDRNSVTPIFRNGWLSKNGRGIDELAQELSGYGVEVTNQNVVDFMLEHPNGKVRRNSEEIDVLGQRFSEVASQVSGMKIGRPDSPTGKLFIEKLKTSENAEQLKQQIESAQQAENEVLRSMAEQHEAEQQNDPYRTLTDEEVDVVMSRMQEDAVEAPILELTPDNWTNEFGDNGVIDTPIGKVKMGENQYLKFAKLGRDSQLGMVKPTLTNPDVVIEDKSGGVDSERNSSYVYVKTFTDKSGKKHTYFTSVTVLKEGMEVSVSSHIKNKNRVKSLLKEGNLLWNRFGFDSDASGEYQDYTTVTALNPSDNERGTTSQSKLLSENKDTEVSGEKQAGDTDVHFRNVGDIEGINQRFNDELQQQITGTLPKGHVYQIGRPSSVLLSAGIPNLPIELSAERLLAKASKEYDSNHPFDLKNIENLPEALNHPIVVFDARKKNGGKVVLTELKQGDNNFVVALHVRKSDDSRKIDIEVNSVRSLYPKDRSNGILDWINGGLMNWVDKEKAFNFFSTQWPNYIASGGNTESSEVLSSATNILQNFQNPSIEEGKVSAEIDNMPDSFDFSKAIKEAKQKAVSSGVNKISYIKIGGERVIESYVPNPTKDKWTKDQAPFVWVKEASNGYIKEENDVDDVDVRYRERSSENVNEQFNRELDSLTEENANGKVFHLGIPSKSLLSVGIPNKPFRLYGNKLLKKAKKHGFKPTDIKNLPYALENPIAVFEGNHRSSYAILTELEIGDNKVLVSVETNKDGEIDFNLVSSVFGKSSRSIVNWINSDKLRFSDKEKTLNYLSASALNADATNNSELSSATNIAQNFVNPTLEEGEISSSIDELSQELGVKVNKVQSRDDLPEGMRRGMKGGRYPGLFDPKSGKVYVVLNEIENVADAQATVLHEVIGHKGIRGLFGERLPEFCERVLASLPEGKRVKLLEKYEGNGQLAAEEYVAGFAEEYSDPSGWEKVKAIVKEFLRDLTGIDLKLSDNDLKYILWKAKNGLKEGGMMSAIEGVVRDNRVQDVLFRQQHPDLRTAEEFIKEKRSGLEATKERFVDSAVAVKELTDFLKGRGIKIRDFEDAYSESLLSDSKSYHAINRYQEQYQQPLNEAIAALRSKGRELRDVYHYLIAKHASERNREIGNREYEKWLDGKHRDLLAEKKKFEFFKKNGKKDDAEYDKKLKAFEEGVARSNRKFEEERAVKEVEFRSRIYAGMSDEDAAVIVRDFEAGCSKEEISNLWEKIRAATNFAIERQFKDGLIPKESYESMRGTYEYYIPLKGWEETDGVDYSASERYRTPANVSKLVEARGRVSMADNPVAYIEMAAEGAIVEGNRNYVRQCLYNMCVNNPDESLYSVNRTYYVEKDGEWIAQTEKPAKELFDNGTAKTVLTDKPYKALVSDANAQRYDVTVLINGEKNTISFAQGSKGLDIADAINRTRMWKPGKVSRAFGHLTRFLSAQNTSRNPEFIVRNFERDFLYAVPAYAIKGGNSIKLIANLRPAFKALHTEFMQRGDKKNSELNRYMDEFLNAGGKTGFVHSLDMESRKRKAEREIRRIINRDSAGGRARAVGKAIGSTMEYLSDISENSIRFAVFLTERQAGKGVKEAAIAAKEITVNFNRKGTVTPAMSQYFAFFNAGVQGSLYNFLGLGLKWGNRFLVANAALGAIQMVAAQLSRCFGDDDELGVSDYDRLSDYTRNNNIILPDVMRISELFGGEKNEEARKYGFMTIPMSQSFRAVSAVGIITDQVLRERKSPSDGITEIVDNILANMSPLDLETYNFTNGKPWMFFLRALPTAMQPVVDLMTNKNFMGSDVFKEPFTKNMEGMVPQSSLGMKNTNPLLVSISKGLNRWASGTTDINPELQTDAATGEVSRNKMMSYVDINPAKVEHIIEGITGGAGKFVNNFFKTASSLVTGGELESRDIPFVRTHRTMPYRQTHWEMFFEARESVADVDFVANTHKKNRNFGIYTKILTNGGQLMNSTSYECIDKLVRGFREVAATATTEESKKNWTEIIDRTVLNWAKGQKQVYDKAIKDDDKKKKQ